MDKIPKIKEHGFILLSVSLSLGGAIGAVVTGFGDFVHYMNRDITTWIYASEGFIWLLMTIGFILQLIMVSY